MNRDDTGKFLLYIEPDESEKSEVPVDDCIAELIDFAMSKALCGAANYSAEFGVEEVFREKDGYRGFHHTNCGECSSNHDYLLESGHITNSLAPFYVRHYRSSIKPNDLDKLESLAKHYNYNINGVDNTIKLKLKFKLLKNK